MKKKNQMELMDIYLPPSPVLAAGVNSVGEAAEIKVTDKGHVIAVLEDSVSKKDIRAAIEKDEGICSCAEPDWQCPVCQYKEWLMMELNL